MACPPAPDPGLPFGGGPPPLTVTITSAEWYGFSRSIRVIGDVTGWTVAPTVAYTATGANPGSGAVTIDGVGHFDFYVPADTAGTTTVTVTATP